MGDHAGAVTAHKKALALSPECWEAYENASTCLGELGQWQDAIHILEEERARRRDGGSAEMYHNLAIALRMVRRYEDGAVVARQAIERDPECAGAYGTLAGALADRGRWKEAVPHLRRLLQIKGDSASSSDYFNLGVALAETSDFTGAREPLEKAVALAPDDIEALLRLAAVQSELGLSEDAVTILEHAIKKHPQVAEAHGLLGAALHSVGRHQAAVVALERAGREDSDYFRRYPAMADLLAKARNASTS